VARGQWSEVEARGVLSAWRKSGTSIEKFAAERGLVAQRLYWWRKKLETKPPSKALAMLPVHVAEAKRGEPITILLRTGHMVKVGRGFDEEALARVVAVLEGA
jgi:hypothetical protein